MYNVNKILLFEEIRVGNNYYALYMVLFKDSP